MYNPFHIYADRSVGYILQSQLSYITFYPSGVLIIFQANGMLLPLFTIVILIDTLCVIYVLPQVGS